MKFPAKGEIWESRQYPGADWAVKVIGSGFARPQHIGRSLHQGAAVFIVSEIVNPAEGVEPWFELAPLEAFLQEYKLRQ